MASIFISLPYQYDEVEIEKFLKDHNLKHIAAHDDYYIKRGDGIRGRSGHMARVLDTPTNEVGEPFMVIANNNLSKNKMYDEFQSYEERD